MKNFAANLLNRLQDSVILSAFLGLLTISSIAHASNEEMAHVLSVANGIAHPSYNGVGNPIGFIYNKGASLYATGSGSGGSISYGGGLAYGTKPIGLGISAYSSNSGTSTANIQWGLGVEASSFIALGVGGSSAPNIASVMFNPEGTHRFGLGVTNLSGGSSSFGYLLGYAYEGKPLIFSLGGSYFPNSNVGAASIGLGVHSDSYLIVLDYTIPFTTGTGNSGTSAGTFGGGAGFSLGKVVDLALTYNVATTTGTAGTYSLLLNFSI